MRIFLCALALLAGCATPEPAGGPSGASLAGPLAGPLGGPLGEPSGGPGAVVALEARFGAMARARGSAVLLPGGLALTAAHVVDEASLREELCRQGRWPAEDAPYLAALTLRGAGGAAVPATRQRLGRSTFTPAGSPAGSPTGAMGAAGCDLAYRAGQDLALLRLAAALPGQVPARVCATDPLPGQWVRAASAGRVVLGQLAGEVAEADQANGRYAVLALRLEQGESGGGVFDAASGCLLGIVSMRDPAAPDRSWLVRAAVIRAFLAGE